MNSVPSGVWALTAVLVDLALIALICWLHAAIILSAVSGNSGSGSGLVRGNGKSSALGVSFLPSRLPVGSYGLSNSFGGVLALPSGRSCTGGSAGFALGFVAGEIVHVVG